MNQVVKEVNNIVTPLIKSDKTFKTIDSFINIEEQETSDTPTFNNRLKEVNNRPAIWQHTVCTP